MRRGAAGTVGHPMSEPPRTDPGRPTRSSIIGAGPAGLTAAYMLTKRGVTVDRARGRLRRRRHQPHRRARRLALRHRRAPLLHQGEAGRGRSGSRSSPDEDFLLPPADEPHLLPRASSTTTRSSRRTRCTTSARSRRCAAGSPTCGRGSGRRRTRTRSRVTSSPSFGWRLYHHFFKTYNEKVWGVPVNEIAADLGAQRIKNLSLFAAVVERCCCQAATRRTSPADRGVQLPEVRPRDDVGALHRAHQGRGLQGLIGHR